MTDMIRAAGAVIWRGDEADPQVALVHRPKYDDWSFPKGKLHRDEHVIAGALREVGEETGLRVVLGRALPPVHYLWHGRLKRVDYWSAQAVGEIERPAGEDEVDELVWMSLAQARRRLTYEWDIGLLSALTAAPLSTRPLILVRHAHAGSRSDWKGDDDKRPLDAAGEAQARTLATALAGYRPAEIVSSPSRRCVQTVKPFAHAADLPVRKEKLLSETDQDAEETFRLVRELQDAAVVCSHGKVLPGLFSSLVAGRTADTTIRKGAFAVLHYAGEDLISVERYLT